MRNNRFSWKTLILGKRLLLLLVLLVAMSAVVILVVPFGPRGKKNIAFTPPKTKEEALANLNRDSDNDGLKDWEEKIYATDPANADTDGDSTPDGQELKDGRNPLKPGPDDKLEIPLPQPENNNKTELLASSIASKSLTKIVIQAANGESVNNALDEFKDPKEIDNLIASLGKEQPLDKVIQPQLKELITTADNSPEAVKKYFNTIAKIQLVNFLNMESDISILYLAQSSGNVKAFRRLDANIATIEKVIAEIKQTPVPTKWVSFAKNLVWYLSKTLAAVKILRDTENDPVSSLLILQGRIQLIDDFANLYQDTKLQLTGIDFSENEPAYGLFLKIK
ncbi:MAG: hypothetical protein Q7R91_01585 [bacterium]|nr:hypothetical protein [bacterium]